MFDLVKSPHILIGHMQPAGDPVRAAAERAQPEMAAQLLALWRSAAAAGKYAPAEAARQAGVIMPSLMAAWGGGRAALGDQLGLVQKFKVEFVLDRLAPQSDNAAQDWAAQFVREIGEDVRVTINSTVVEGMRDGLNPYDLGRNVRESIGLTTAQARAVRNYRSALEGNSPASLQYRLRDRRFDQTTETAIQEGVPLSRDQIDTRVQRYRDRYLKYRADTIARYETLYASNAGAVSAIRTARHTGALTEGATKRWLLANDERVCPRCRSIVQLQPDGVPLDDKFEWEHGKNGGLIDFPPLHPSCRCTISFRVK